MMIIGEEEKKKREKDFFFFTGVVRTYLSINKPHIKKKKKKKGKRKRKRECVSIRTLEVVFRQKKNKVWYISGHM
jgi:hypothetical protein